jgi:hypothetical protein
MITIDDAIDKLQMLRRCGFLNPNQEIIDVIVNEFEVKVIILWDDFFRYCKESDKELCLLGEVKDDAITLWLDLGNNFILMTRKSLLID